MNITQFNKENLKIMRQEMNDALKSVADKYSLRFDIGSIRFAATNFRCKIECCVLNGVVPQTTVINSSLSSGLPQIGVEYQIGDERNGQLKVKVIKLRRSKALVEITERIGYGSKRKCNSFEIGQEIRSLHNVQKSADKVTERRKYVRPSTPLLRKSENCQQSSGKTGQSTQTTLQFAGSL